MELRGDRMLIKFICKMHLDHRTAIEQLMGQNRDRELAARNAELERRLAALEEAVARSKGSEDGQAARADALESALESAVERQRRRKGLVKKVTKAGAKVARCREELRDAEEKLAGALREAQAALENAAGDEE